MASDFTLFHHRLKNIDGVNFSSLPIFRALTIRKRRAIMVAFVSLFKLELTARGFIERAYALWYKYMRLIHTKC